MQNVEGYTQSTQPRLEQREINFVLRVLGFNTNQSPDLFTLMSWCNQNSSAISLRATLHGDMNLHIQPNQLITEEILKTWVNFECIPESHFSWIDTKNERLCDFIWSYVRLIKPNSLAFLNYPPYIMPINIDKDDVLKFSYPLIDIPSLGQSFIYDNFSLERLPLSSKKKDCIIAFFDVLNAPHITKISILNMLKEKWILISKNDDVVRWANNTKAEWAWDYFKKDYFKKNNNYTGSPNWFIINNKSSDYLKGVITAFDLLTDFPDRRELLLKKLKLAWAQQSYRNSNNGKKAVSIVLQEDVIKKLNDICIAKDRRKNEVITRLIMEEYKKLKTNE